VWCSASRSVGSFCCLELNRRGRGDNIFHPPSTLSAPVPQRFPWAECFGHLPPSARDFNFAPPRRNGNQTEGESYHMKKYLIAAYVITALASPAMAGDIDLIKGKMKHEYGYTLQVQPSHQSGPGPARFRRPLPTSS
jgi:hypothetical protein